MNWGGHWTAVLESFETCINGSQDIFTEAGEAIFVTKILLGDFKKLCKIFI
jgi:hypothetical protein